MVLPEPMVADRDELVNKASVQNNETSNISVSSQRQREYIRKFVENTAFIPRISNLKYTSIDLLYTVFFAPHINPVNYYRSTLPG